VEHRKFGCLRVSSKNQNESRQLEAIKKEDAGEAPSKLSHLF